MLTHEQAAQAMGMKTREITAVEAHARGYVVTTFDGQRTLLERAAKPGPAAATPAPPAEPVMQVPAKRTPAKRTAGKRQGKTATPSADCAGPEPVDGAELAALLDGPAEQLLGWVGQDPGRAHAAHTAESDRPEPRVDLLLQLEQLADAS